MIHLSLPWVAVKDLASDGSCCYGRKHGQCNCQSGKVTWWKWKKFWLTDVKTIWPFACIKRKFRSVLQITAWWHSKQRPLKNINGKSTLIFIHFSLHRCTLFWNVSKRSCHHSLQAEGRGEEASWRRGSQPGLHTIAAIARNVPGISPRGLAKQFTGCQTGPSGPRSGFCAWTFEWREASSEWSFKGGAENWDKTRDFGWYREGHGHGSHGAHGDGD